MHFVRFQAPSGPRWGRLTAGTIHELDGAPYSGGKETGATYPAEGATLLSPVEPSKIVAIGRNYHEHAAEFGNVAPSEPMLFFKAPSSLIGQGEAIELAFKDHSIHWEAELAAVIGRTCRKVSEAEALDYVFGWTIANDVSDRDQQKGDAPFGFGRAKSYDTYTPCGPVLVTEGVDPANAHITLACNGEVRQSDPTSLLVHNVPKLISHISHIMTLVPGDLILTGTPKGVGPMKPGDLVEITIEGIGTLRNPVV
jgi:2-keto-4-pentenoate hydratase/2-oxohepta-3-ene-1,7-dioic acid hydratase in catechol pathway